MGCQNYAKDDEQFSQDEKIIIRFSHVVGEDTPKGQAARKFAELMKLRSHGKVEVQVFSNGSLYRDGEEWKALKKNDVQIIAPSMSKLIPRIPELQVLDLPFYFKDLEQIHQLADGEVGKMVFHSAERNQVVPLAIWDNGFKQFTNRDHSLHNSKDFAGLRFRIMPSPILEEQFSRVGAVGEVKNFNDVYQALKNKEVDGQENTISNIYTKRFFNVQDYLILSNHGYLGYLVMMNQEFFQSLNPEIQTMIQDAMNEVTIWEREKSLEIEKKQLNLIKDCECIQVESLTEEEKNHLKRSIKHSIKS
ncbi:DctP family TRAP transporter solute-binding subunit [Tepidibacillus marianensis]|uniref:DctP family TRAP transporter solute-binding subunit n=1 Tax=Tepidibacillus marianensis TaxID=3131995 RepID=UPI0030CD0B47